MQALDTAPMEKTVERTAFGQRLLDAREAAGFSKMDVQRRIGLKQPSLTELERTGMSSGFTVKLANLYGVRPEWLDAGEGPRTADPFGQLPNGQTWRELALEAADLASEGDREFLRAFLQQVDAMHTMARRKRVDIHIPAPAGKGVSKL